jgi:hypothetical protein
MNILLHRSPVRLKTYIGGIYLNNISVGKGMTMKRARGAAAVFFAVLVGRIVHFEGGGSTRGCEQGHYAPGGVPRRSQAMWPSVSVMAADDRRSLRERTKSESSLGAGVRWEDAVGAEAKSAASPAPNED